MTMMQDRPAPVRRPRVVRLAAPVRREPVEPIKARSLGLSELMGRRPDLHDVYSPATVAADAILWSA